MKQSILILLCLILIGCSGNAPLKKELVEQAPQESPVIYFNAFQNSTNVDSSLYFARKLASDPKNAVLLQDLLHNSFAQEFTNHPQTINDPSKRDELSKRLKWSKLLLSRMAADSNKRLAQSVAQSIIGSKCRIVKMISIHNVRLPTSSLKKNSAVVIYTKIKLGGMPF